MTVPEDCPDEIRAHCLATMRGFRSARVEARVHDVRWRTSVFPMKSGGYFLPVKAEVRRKTGIAAGTRSRSSWSCLKRGNVGFCAARFRPALSNS